MLETDRWLIKKTDEMNENKDERLALSCCVLLLVRLDEDLGDSMVTVEPRTFTWK